MKKILLAAVLAAAALLAGCDDGNLAKRAAERSLIQEQLPPGCRFVPLPDYGRQSVNVVICSGRATSTTNTTWSTTNGKQVTAHFAVAAVVNEGPL